MLPVPINFGLGSFGDSGAQHWECFFDELTPSSPHQHFGLLISLSQQAVKETTVLDRVVELYYKMGLGFILHNMGKKDYVWNPEGFLVVPSNTFFANSPNQSEIMVTQHSDPLDMKDRVTTLVKYTTQPKY